MITKLLIANRGEIARRIRRTANAMGIMVVAVYTSGEEGAPHVAEADEAVRLSGSGPAPYLDAQALVEAARRVGADGVHPGYGFLAENADFARAVSEAGLTWVGPPAEAIARMGDKIEAKRTADAAGVPVLEQATPDAAGSLELPLMVKAAAGGGGKGMRIVRDRDAVDDAVAAARREAERSFGDPTVFLEPFLDGCRHVEIQVLGDGRGNLIHLFERECSIQRRHQKVLEEAPSPVVEADLRERMGEAALSLCREIGYRSAGTVEMLLDRDGRFFFLEMNTRLQVEHPVTEEITGVDLVRQQLLEASGEGLTVSQEELGISGHAIEVRLNAEDPTNDYLPSGGTVVGWDPCRDPEARFESGIEVGSVVGTSFDPLLAKVIVHAPTREEAARRLALALERTTVQGVTTNRDLLVDVLRHEAFLTGDTTTDFLERVELRARRELDPHEREAALASAALAAAEEARSAAPVLGTMPSGWRNSVMPPQRRLYSLGGEEVVVAYRRAGDGEFAVDCGSGERRARLVGSGGSRTVELDGTGTPVRLRREGGSWWVHGPWGDVEVVERSPFPTARIEEAPGSLVAPMPGTVVSVRASEGDAVKQGETLVVLEAMKMEHPIAAPEDGTVAEVNVAAGDQVERGTVLVVVRPDGEEDAVRPSGEDGAE